MYLAYPNSISNSGSEKLHMNLGWRMVQNRGHQANENVARVIDSYMQKLDSLKGIQLGKTLTPLDSRTESVRAKEATMGNMFADAVREMTGSDVVIIQGGSIRGDYFYGVRV